MFVSTSAKVRAAVSVVGRRFGRAAASIVSSVDGVFAGNSVDKL